MATLYRQGGQLEEAMEAINNAKSTCPTNRLDLLSSISMTKFMLHQDMSRSTGSSQELEYAVAEGEVALQVRFDMPHSQRAMLLTGVAQSICALCEAQPHEADFEGRGRDAIQYARQSVGLSAGKQRIEAGIVLARALSSRRIKPTIQELDEAISLYRKAKDSEALRGDQELLANLANATCFRCEKGGEVPECGTTFQSAVELYQEALVASDDNRWNSRIANNIACIYVDKANNTEAEVDYRHAHENYLKAVGYLEAAAKESDDPGDVNDVGYYKDQAEAIAKTITSLKEGVRDVGSRQTAERKPTPKRRSTARGSL
jgi:tetratricopeptide (TPR) repeat protein